MGGQGFPPALMTDSGGTASTLPGFPRIQGKGLEGIEQLGPHPKQR
jgi:hypothetical protein